MADEEAPTGFTPDMSEDSGLMCFLNEARQCGPTCMAYITFSSENAGDLQEQQTHCSLLRYTERASRHLVIITSLLAKAEKKAATARDDQKREAGMDLMPRSPFPRKT